MEEQTEIKQEEIKEKSKSLIEQANEAAERIEKANKQQEELLKKNEEIMTRSILGGRSEANIPKKELTEEDKVREQANTYIKSLGMKPI